MIMQSDFSVKIAHSGNSVKIVPIDCSVKIGRSRSYNKDRTVKIVQSRSYSKDFKVGSYS